MTFRLLLMMPLLLSAALYTRGMALTDTLRRNSLIYNGTEYSKQFTVDMGSPFFPAEITSGSIVYSGAHYAPVDFYYDCQDDVLLIKDSEGRFRLQLIKEKLESFDLGGQHFVKLNLQSPRGEIYEQAFKGKRWVLVKWQKNLERNMQELMRFQLSKTYYLYDGQVLQPLQRSTDLYKAMGPFARKARQWLRDDKLSFRKDPVKMIVSLVQKAEAAGW